MSINITSSYKRGSYGDIEESCQQVMLKTDDVARFSDLQKQVDVIKPLLESFINAVAAAADGGKLLTQAKKKAKKELLNEMDILKSLVVIFAKGDEDYATEAGFKLREKPIRNNQPLSRPKWMNIKRGVLLGTIEGELKKFPKGVTSAGVKHSYDGWVTEKNGTYTTGQNFVLEGLESKREVEVKVCFHGTFQRKSNDSDSMSIFVL